MQFSVVSFSFFPHTNTKKNVAEEEDQQEEEEQRGDGSGDSDENLAKIAANVMVRMHMTIIVIFFIESSIAI